ncbi:MAG: flavodoxin family protein [Candidatus Latescibacterota bacterium]
MARLMAVQGSGRRHGFTATLMKEVVESLRDVSGLEVEVYHLHDYTYGPCKSCFHCIRNIGQGCVQNDDWGKRGEGELFKAFMRANGLLIVDPVHGWTCSAEARVFIERIYPTIWEGIPNGMPFASISIASNQGFQTRAARELCKFAAGKAFRFIGSLPVHVAYMVEARRKGAELAHRAAEAAIADEKNGRRKLTDEEIFLMYMDTPWDMIHGYLENLTDGSFRYDDSVPANALRDGVFTNPDAQALLEKTCENLKIALAYFDAGEKREAAVALSRAAKFWTNATFKQFLEKDVVKAEIPKAYHPLDEL